MDKVCADVVFLHGCPQSCMPNRVEGLLEVYEDMVEALLVIPPAPAKPARPRPLSGPLAVNPAVQ